MTWYLYVDDVLLDEGFWSKVYDRYVEISRQSPKGTRVSISERKRSS